MDFCKQKFRRSLMNWGGCGGGDGGGGWLKALDQRVLIVSVDFVKGLWILRSDRSSSQNSSQFS
jgi:hypothetical protein